MWLVNGRSDGVLDPRDRGLQYGDGLFETLAVRDRRPRHWTRHMARLARGCERLGMPAPDFERLAREADQVCAGADSAVLKVVWTRGPGGRGYAPSGADRPTRMVALYPPPEYPAEYFDQGITARWCRHRMGDNPALAGIKHLNRLDQVMARAEWQDPRVAEGLVRDLAGNVVSGTMTNVFVARNGVLCTPGLERCGVEGVARERLLELAAGEGIRCEVGPMAPEQLLEADEVFVCNSVNGIWQVRSLETRNWPQGELSRHLAACLDAD